MATQQARGETKASRNALINLVRGRGFFLTRAAPMKTLSHRPKPIKSVATRQASGAMRVSRNAPLKLLTERPEGGEIQVKTRRLPGG